MPETDTEQASEVIDLGYDVSEADVARPVLQGGTLKCTIVRTYTEPSRKQQIPTIVVVYRTAEKTKDTKGRDVNPGFRLMQRIITKPTGGLTEQMIQDKLKQIHFAAAGEGRVNTGAWIGKTVNCRIQLREPHTDQNTGISYDESNEIQRVMPVK